MSDDLEPLREQFLDAAQALLDAERKDDAGVINAAEVRKLTNGLELLAETNLAETAEVVAKALPPAESVDDPPCP